MIMRFSRSLVSDLVGHLANFTWPFGMFGMLKNQEGKGSSPVRLTFASARLRREEVV